MEHVDKKAKVLGTLLNEENASIKPEEQVDLWEAQTKGVGMKLMTKMGYIGSGGVGSERCGVPGRSEPVEVNIRPRNQGLGYESMVDMKQMLANGTIIRFANAPNQRPGSSDSINSFSNHFQDKEEQRTKKPWEKRITELLEENLSAEMKLKPATRPTAAPSTEGDIQSLCLHSAFFVEGVRIGWPFPVIMPPQRQMALHLIKALKNRRHVVLESPTGTGKSAAILCSVLAWQRYHQKMHPTDAGDGPSTPRIIYCSRTHSQVAQMISSLRKTPYRPKMAVLGSRDRLCIHKKIRNRGTPEDDEKNKKPVNVNQECRTRVQNTEAMRKQMWQAKNDYYDDDNPPDRLVSDTTEATNQQIEAEDGEDWIETGKNDRPCCPHYRQLSTSRTAKMTFEQFVPQEKNLCCSIGGEMTKVGTHDIEDLVDFAKDPYLRRDVAVHRPQGEGSFGMSIGKFGTKIKVGAIIPDGAVDMEGSLHVHDEIVRLNGDVVDGKTLDEVVDKMKLTEDPLLLDITSESLFRADDSGYSDHSPCPYYLSRALSKSAELIFCPYNYILDPSIRKALDIDLNGAVCVLDEAHNVEGTLRESGSGKFGEIGLCEIVAMLNHFSAGPRTHRKMADAEGNEKDISELAHSLLLFVEQLITFLMEAKIRFEQNPGKNGARSVIVEWERFHTPDDTEFEMTYDGPSGRGERGKAVGCRTFFDKLSLTLEKVETLLKYGEGLTSHVTSGDGANWEQRTYSNLLDNLTDMLSKFAYALKKPEYYYVASVVKANGNLEFAAGMASGGLRSQRENRFKRPHKKWPSIAKDNVVDRCFHAQCRETKSGPHFQEGAIRHGTYCNGKEQPWEAVLVLELLTPATFMEVLAKQCHTVVLASGSLSPISSLCGELGLLGNANDDDKKEEKLDVEGKQKADGIKSEESTKARLQVKPKPLEANHVIDLEKQLLAVSIGHFDDGSPITMTYNNYKKDEFITKLGGAIASVIEAVPTGGALVFLPSYSLLRKCVKSWNPYDSRRGRGAESHGYNGGGSVWDRFENSKGKVIVEPTGNQARFEEARDDYADTIRNTGNCILLAVFRGKMSEGISFNDANARAVICVGIPYPMKSLEVRSKIDFNTEQRLLNKRTDLLPGNEWYSQQAYRAIAQALGRCIRHGADYGAVVLMDSRHCDDGEPVEGICRAHLQLPKWMRHHVRNLSKRTMGDPFGKSVHGSWPGLQIEMSRFFQQAPIHSQWVLTQQQEQLQRARDREQTSQNQTTPGQKLDQTTTGGSTPEQSSGTPISAEVTPSQQMPPGSHSSNYGIL